jgi:ketosteroid isomerase-like protein
MKKNLVAIGLAILLFSLFFIWRSFRPALSDQEQIAANFNRIEVAADNRRVGDIVFFLSKDFDFNGTKKRELQKQLIVGIMQYRVVDLELRGVEIEVNAETETAISEGRFSLTLKNEFNSTPEIINGDFELEWRKDAGSWKVTKAKGSPKSH